MFMIKLRDILNEGVKDGVVTCDNCNWHWDISDGGDSPYLCHKCGNDNTPISEDLRKWFGKGKTGGWDRYNSKGEKAGKCGDSDKGSAYAACLSNEKAAKLGKDGRASFVKRKRAAQKDAGDSKKGGEQKKGQKPTLVKTGASENINEAGMNPVKKVVNAILKKHNIQAMKTYASSVRGAHNIINGGYRWEGDWHLGFYGNVPQDVVEKVAAEMEKAGVKYVKVKKGHISADFSKTGLSEATLNELKLNDLVGNQYKYVIGSGEEKYLGKNDKKYVLEMIAKALETYLYDHNFALNYLEGSQRKQYESFFEKEVLKPMLSKIDFTLNNFFTLDKDKVKWNLSSNDTRKMVDEIFRKNSKIPADIKKEYYEYRLDYAGVKLKESSKANIKEYGQALDLHFILNKDAKLDGTPEPKKAIGEELSFDEKQMVIGIIEILKQVEDPKNRMRIALNMLKKFKEENIEFDY